MKKVIAMLVCLLLATSVAVAALATDAVQMTITPETTSVYRGDTVEFSITMSQVYGCRSAAILLEDCFDEDVFEFVSGKCTVTEGDVTLNTFDYIGGKLSGCFTYYGTYPDISGEIFTFTMKVKETAPLGDTTISGIANTHDANGSIDTTVNAATVTIACKHNWTDWENQGDEHVHNCLGCGISETASHAWDEGKITTPATCKEEGVKTYSCECGATKTELVAKSEDHAYSGWSQVDEYGHEKVCSVCEKTVSAAHAWDEGTVKIEPSCVKEGMKIYTCECSATKVETLPATGEHIFGQWNNVDAESHMHSCSSCGMEETAAHTWDEGTVKVEPMCAADGMKIYTCTECDAAKDETLPATGAHVFGQWENVDGENHKHACSGCGMEETAAHTWDEGKVTVEATCGADGTKIYTCADCAATKTEAIPATGAHVYGTQWKADAENHWHECVCGAKADVAVHEFTEEIIDDAHMAPGGDAYYYDCAHCDTMGTETFTTALRGDLDGDGDVDEDDAIYLLQYVLLPDLFPVTQTVDYDKDSDVDEDDAIYLLQYVLLPDLFPLN